MKFIHKVKNYKWWWIAGAIALIWYALCLPRELFMVPYSTVIESREGVLLNAQIANDGQWRFPELDSLPSKYETCLLSYEDAYFYSHPGFNPVSILKALQANISAGRVVRGGSTITQQVVRLSRKRNRNYLEKLIEVVWATRLELRESKKSILQLYASHAPYGGNVIGLEMAAWRYFQRKPHQLSWAESATLAVLPNAPGLIFPGRKQEALQSKRNALLLKLLEEKTIDSTDYELAIAEELPQKAFKIPQLAPHLMQRTRIDYGNVKLKTSVSANHQITANKIIANHHSLLKQNGINNAALLVLHIPTKQVLAYVGNTNTTKEHHKDVDIITAARSTGSVLKPFLYASMLNNGELLPESLIPDIPTTIDGYITENYNKTFTGAVPASKALARSLNIPAVRMLQDYQVPRFYNQLKSLHLHSIDRSPSNYGLSLILGGAESSLWELSRAYLGLANTLHHYTLTSSLYFNNEFENLSYKNEVLLDSLPFPSLELSSAQPQTLGAGSIYFMLEAMKKVNRPEGEEIWHFYNTTKEVAWKTGTSYGNRDAWAIGLTSEYVVGVWTGNADGEGRAGMTGITSAAPILFDMLNSLPDHPWFAKPYDDLTSTEVCAQSGYLVTPYCEKITTDIPSKGERFLPCPYHKMIHVNQQETYRVNSTCEPIAAIKQKAWFELPPIMAWYYNRSHTDYAPVPPMRPDCLLAEEQPMKFIFPANNARIILPRDHQGTRNPLVMKLAHTYPQTEVYWYLNDRFIGVTKEFHEITTQPETGNYLITAMDEHGNSIKHNIVIE